MFAKQTTELNNAGIKAGSILRLNLFNGEEVWVELISYNARTAEFELLKLNSSKEYKIRAVFNEGRLFEAPDHDVDMYDVHEGVLINTTAGVSTYHYGMKYLPHLGCFLDPDMKVERVDDFKPGFSYVIRKELLDEFPGLTKRTVTAIEGLIGTKIDPNQLSTTGVMRSERDNTTGAMTVHLDAKHTAMVIDLTLTALETFNTVSKILKTVVGFGKKCGIKSFFKEKAKAINRRERELTFRTEKSDKGSWDSI